MPSPPSQVNGAVVNVRPGHFYRVCIWVVDKEQSGGSEMQTVLRQRLGLQEGYRFQVCPDATPAILSLQLSESFFSSLL